LLKKYYASNKIEENELMWGWGGRWHVWGNVKEMGHLVHLGYVR